MMQNAELEKSVLEKLRSLTPDQQQAVLKFVDSLSAEPTASSKTKLSLRQIAVLPIAERHKIIAPMIADIAADFQADPELTEFAVLDGEDWDDAWDDADE
jgi:hypothetical protein